MDIIREVTKEQTEKDIPSFRAGDTVRVYVHIVEPGNIGAKQRVRPQLFEGVVTRRHNGGVSSTFTVRKISYGVGVERVFPLYSPRIEKIEVGRRGKVRRGRLYYLRSRRGRAARLKEMRTDRVERKKA